MSALSHMFWGSGLIPDSRNPGVFTLHQKSIRIRTGLKPDRGNAHSFMHISRNRTSTLRLRMSRDCHARAVLLVKNGSSTIDNRDAPLPSMVPRLLWAFLRLRRTHRALRVSKERRFLRRWRGSASLRQARSGHL